jgi:hypothetical protein
MSGVVDSRRANAAGKLVQARRGVASMPVDEGLGNATEISDQGQHGREDFFADRNFADHRCAPARKAWNWRGLARGLGPDRSRPEWGLYREASL